MLFKKDRIFINMQKKAVKIFFYNFFMEDIKMKNKLKFLWIAFLITTFVFGACDSGSGGGGGGKSGGGSLTISVGNNSRAIDTGKIEHRITVTDSSGTEQKRTINSSGGTANFSSLALGLCAIDVQGYLDGKHVSYSDKITVDIKAGPNGSVPIVMNLFNEPPNEPGTPEKPNKINISAISGVTVPVLGEAPVTKITDTTQYTGTVSWKTGNDTHNPSDPFGPAKVYTATITLTPKSGFTFEGVTSNSFTVAGADEVYNEPGSGVVTAVFPLITIPEPYNVEGAAAVASFLRSLNLDMVTITEDGEGCVIVVHIPGEAEETAQITLDIPDGVKVEWGIGGYYNVSGPVLTLRGSGTLELTSEYNILHANGGDAIYIESGSPTLVISRTVNIFSIDGTAIKTALGSSPNIFLSNASGVGGGAINGGAIVLLGGGNIVVTGSTTIVKGTYATSFIYRDPSATVNGFYDNNTNKAYFNGGDWAEGKNLYPE
jgi:hypothetical protein